MSTSAASRASRASRGAGGRRGIARVVPLVAGLAEPPRPGHVRRHLPAGRRGRRLLEAAPIVNDVSGLLYPEVAGLAADAAPGWSSCTPGRGPSTRCGRRPVRRRGGVTGDVVAPSCASGWSWHRRRRARGGDDPRPRARLRQDPAQTVEVLRALDRGGALGRPLLLALSRKDFIGAVTGRRRRSGWRGPWRRWATPSAGPPGPSCGSTTWPRWPDYLAVASVLAGQADLPPRPASATPPPARRAGLAHFPANTTAALPPIATRWRWRPGRRGGRPGGPGGARPPRRPGPPTTSTTSQPRRSAGRTRPWCRPMRRRPPGPAPSRGTRPGQTADGAERGDHHRLAPDHRPHLRPGLAHRPQQAELAGPLVDRQRQRVGDAHQGDDDRQRQQGVDDGQQHVDAGWVIVAANSSLVRHVGAAVALGHLGDRRLGVGHRGSRGRRPRTPAVSMSCTAAAPTPSGAAGSRRPGRRRRRWRPIVRSSVAVGERERHARRPRPVVVLGGGVGHGHLAVADVGQRAVGDVEVEHLGQLPEVGDRQASLVSPSTWRSPGPCPPPCPPRAGPRSRRQLGADAPAAEAPGGHDQVAAEAPVDRVVDRRLAARRRTR